MVSKHSQHMGGLLTWQSAADSDIKRVQGAGNALQSKVDELSHTVATLEIANDKLQQDIYTLEALHNEKFTRM